MAIVPFLAFLVLADLEAPGYRECLKRNRDAAILVGESGADACPERLLVALGQCEYGFLVIAFLGHFLFSLLVNVRHVHERTVARM
jgi:hypothetical protein